MRTALTATVVAALTAVAIAGSATAASATTTTTSAEVVGIVKTTTRAYSQPTTASAPIRTFESGTRVLVRCWQDGQPVSGNTIWLRVGTSGPLVFVPAGTTHVDPASWARVPHCAA